MVLYGITLVPLAEELRAVDSGLLYLFYVDDMAFDGLAKFCSHILKLLMEMEPDRGYLPEPDKSLFIVDTPWQEEAKRREFEAKGIVLNFVSGSRYLGAYHDPQE